MTHFDPEPQDTLMTARNRYFEANQFGSDGGYNDAWVDFKLGPIPMPFPNTRSRLRAVRLHDLHHVLTGYDTDLRGEMEISAWELGGGCADHWAAWQLNLSGMAGGAVFFPRRTWRAFVRGRHTKNLYLRPYDDALLSREVRAEKIALGLDRETSSEATVADAATYAGYFAAGFVIGIASFAVAVPFAIFANAAALIARRNTRRTTS